MHKNLLEVELVASETCGPTAGSMGLAPHLLPVASGKWGLWRLCALRGAGFPAHDVLKLADRDCTLAVDALIKAEGHLSGVSNRLRTAINAALDELRDQDLWADKNRRDPLLHALTCLNKGRSPKLPAHLPHMAAELAMHREALAAVGRSSEALNSAFESATNKISASIHRLASSKRLQEAIIWQNRHAWHSALQPLLRDVPGTPGYLSRRKQQEELIANYVQRYCVKNDTIGFFGPVGWAHFVPTDRQGIVNPGPGLLASRNVYFEAWCIDAIAAMLSRNEDLRPWLAPRRGPSVHLEAQTMCLPGSVTVKLPAEDAAVLHACNGDRLAISIATTLLEQDLPALKSQEDVYRILNSYSRQGVVVWKLEVPVQRNADQTLRGLIERIGHPVLRESGLKILDKLECCRCKIAAAAGDPEALDHELGALEESFTELTGTPATRAHGQTYAARTLVYEDCRRDAEVKIGSEVLDALAPPLSLLLTSVRWMTYNLASMYREAFHSAYAELVRKTGTPVVNAADFWVKIDPLLYNSKTRIADRILPEFQRKWADVFALAGGATQFDFTCEHLRPKVEEAFAAPYPGWSAARYNSPDIMIAAAGPAALQNGDFTLIVGELHLAINCINGSLFVAQHAEPQEIHDAIMSDFPLPSIVPAPPKNWPGLTARTCFGFISPAAYRLLVSSETCGIPASHAVPISSLVVEQDDDGELVLRTRDNRFRFEIVEGFGGLLADLIVNHFNVLPPVPHSPRITIDRVIVTRETWRFSPSELAFAEENESCGRFLGARRWQQQFGLPRFLFVKSPVERKPFYLDLESPVLVDIFAKVVRRTKKDAHASPLIAISEMVPDCENLWLQDAEGRLYTSEIRMVTLDMTEVPSKP